MRIKKPLVMGAAMCIALAFSGSSYAREDFIILAQQGGGGQGGGGNKDKNKKNNQGNHGNQGGGGQGGGGGNKNKGNQANQGGGGGGGQGGGGGRQRDQNQNRGPNQNQNQNQNRGQNQNQNQNRGQNQNQFQNQNRGQNQNQNQNQNRGQNQNQFQNQNQNQRGQNQNQFQNQQRGQGQNQNQNQNQFQNQRGQNQNQFQNQNRVQQQIQPDRRRLEDFRNDRRRIQQGNQLVIQEGNRSIIRDGNRIFIRRDEGDRFRRFDPNATVRRIGNDTQIVSVNRNGVRVITVTDPNGRLIRRSHIVNGREVILIDNRPRGAGGFFVALPPPVIRIPQDRYIVDAGFAPPAYVYGALMAPPVAPLQRAYSLDEIRYSPDVRNLMPRVDLDTITFDSGSWEVSPDQYNRLAPIADGLKRAIDQSPNEVFLIEGHTDATGEAEDNLSLSDRRAEAVSEILTNQFQIPAENLTSQGYGEQQLKVQTQGPERVNRRVTIRRITPLLQQDANSGGGDPQQGGQQFAPQQQQFAPQQQQFAPRQQ